MNTNPLQKNASTYLLFFPIVIIYCACFSQPVNFGKKKNCTDKIHYESMQRSSKLTCLPLLSHYPIIHLHCTLIILYQTWLMHLTQLGRENAPWLHTKSIILQYQQYIYIRLFKLRYNQARGEKKDTYNIHYKSMLRLSNVN